MRSAVTYVLLATFWFLLSTLSSSEKIDPQSGAVCEPIPGNMRAVRESAEAGDAVEEYQLGRSMLTNKPTEDEFAMAMPWFQRSAEQGYAPAEYMYGSIFREGRWRNLQQLVYWWTKAAEQGEVRAQMWLGVAYEGGHMGIEHDYRKAFKWLSMAAKQGQPDAQVTLGHMYEDGEGVPADSPLATHWYRKAADHVPDLGGAGQGQSSLARFYREGHATPEDYVFVYVWYTGYGDVDGMRDVAKKMTTSQLADAQRRARAWDSPICQSTVVNGSPDSQPQ
jgi:TPR repeat protein